MQAHSFDGVSAWMARGGQSVCAAITRAVEQGIARGDPCVAIVLVGTPIVGKSTLIKHIGDVLAHGLRVNDYATREGLTFSVHPEPVKDRLAYPFGVFLKGGQFSAAAWQMNVLSHYHTVAADIVQQANEARRLPHVAFIERSPRCAAKIFAPLQRERMHEWEWEAVETYAKSVCAVELWQRATYLYMHVDVEAALRNNEVGYDEEYVRHMVELHDAEYGADADVIQIDRTPISFSQMLPVADNIVVEVKNAILKAKTPQLGDAAFDPVSPAGPSELQPVMYFSPRPPRDPADDHQSNRIDCDLTSDSDSDDDYDGEIFSMDSVFVQDAVPPEVFAGVAGGGSK